MTSHETVIRRSQRVAYPFFVAAALLFLLQTLFGLLIAAQYVWPSLLIDALPFNTGRASHLNLMTFWLLLGLMGTSYYLVVEETDSELYSVPLAWANLAVMLVAGVGALASYWFFGLSKGKPFTEAPMPWPIVVVAGVLLFLANVFITLFRARKWNAITFVLSMGLAGLAVLYLFNLPRYDNLTVDYYWWWWIIHLWVEGTWLLIAAAIMSWLLVKLTGVGRERVARWLYIEVSLVLFTGILGIGHHYYWIGTPRYWLLWGAIFSALEPIPMVLMVWDAFSSMRHRHALPADRVTRYWLGGSALGHLLGAGVWGFAITLPQINAWTHGTQVTASHGHFAFFGAFAMLVLAAIYYVVPRLTGHERSGDRRGMWAFWLMTSGMLTIVTAFTVAGVVQTYLVRMLGMDFMTVRTEYVAFWLFWVFAAGLAVFLPGVLVFLWDFLALRRPGVPTVRMALGVLAVVAAGTLVAACARPPEPAPADGRTAVPLDAEQSAAVLGEMRTMLGSLDAVLRAVGPWDTAAIREAALRSGTATAADPALEALLPQPWLEMATRTHQGFDSLAASAGGAATREQVVARLAAITPNCVSCHAMYRLP